MWLVDLELVSAHRIDHGTLLTNSPGTVQRGVMAAGSWSVSPTPHNRRYLTPTPIRVLTINPGRGPRRCGRGPVGPWSVPGRPVVGVPEPAHNPVLATVPTLTPTSMPGTALFRRKQTHRRS